MKKKKGFFRKLINTKGFDSCAWRFGLTMIWLCWFMVCFYTSNNGSKPGEWDELSIVALILTCMAFLIFAASLFDLGRTFKENEEKAQITHESKWPKDTIYRHYTIGVEIYNIFIKWKNEVGVQTLMVSVGENEDKERILEVYTDAPGPMIGYRGETIDKYKRMILAQKDSVRGFVDVRIKPIGGVITATETKDEREFYKEEAESIRERLST